ncbi:MAG TPA: tetratricopeptide repeat protein [Chryseosolibacter sp.]|nr:tetratricopeptide repeat protein [Chryseosolibacter sp.]
MKNPAFCFLLLLLIAACSSERNTWTSKAFHNTTAHYNAYWYAKEEIRKIEKTISDAHVDDYNRILMLFPSFDSSLAKSYDKEIQECIKMASIPIQRHQNSKWVDDSYILVGKARHYSMDWPNAVQAFKYTNKISKNKDAKHLAIIELIRTYIENKEFNNAKSAIDYLEKQKLNNPNKKKFFLEKAYLYQLEKDYDKMVRSLTAASPLLKKSDQRGRIYFIIGQVYQELGFEAEAYNYYKKCIATNPEYEVDFYARLYMAQVTVISRNRDITAARKSFAKLLKDSKNKEFKDKIYYEMGTFEFRRNNLEEAINNYNRSIREGSNKKIDGEAFLRLGEIYYDSLKNYELSQAYYDSAISALPPDYEGYDQIKTRQEILNEFVTHLKTIQWQDSLLTLANIDSVTIRAVIEGQVAERKKQEELNAKKRKRSNRIEIEATDNSAVFGNTENAGMTDEGADWYFGNPSAMAIGQTEFVRKWGNIQLADNWRRSMRQSGNLQRPTGDDAAVAAATNVEEEAKEESVEDIVNAEYQRLISEIPRTPEAVAEANAKIEEAFFKLGEIYYFKLEEASNAAGVYNNLLKRFPDSEYEPEVLYTLYLIHKDSDPTLADSYASRLKEKHPSSTFAKILINPSYLQESSQAAERQKNFYKEAYGFFQAAAYKEADSTLDLAVMLGETSFTPNIELLRVLITGETEDVNRYQYELDELIKKYPDSETGAYAQTLLASSRTFLEVQQKKKGIQYINSLNEPHYFVLLYKRKDKIDEMVTGALEYFNDGHFSDYPLNISSLIFNDEFAMVFVSELPNVSTAIEYYRTFQQNLPHLSDLRNHKFDNFVITKDNFDIFYRTKGLDEYLQFFDKNYPDKNPQ